VGHGNFDAGKKTPPRKSGQPEIQRLTGNGGPFELRIDTQASVKAAPPKVGVAMAQQCGDSGNQSTPQELLQLVGCREPKARLAPSFAPRPIPVRR
jgi:hypothetical protein